MAADTKSRNVVRHQQEQMRRGQERLFSPTRALDRVESSAVFGRLQTDASRRLSQLQIIEEQKRLEAELAKAVSEKKFLSKQEASFLGKRLNEVARLKDAKLAAKQEYKQAQAKAEATRLANLRHPARKLNPKVQERLTKIAANGSMTHRRHEAKDPRGSQQLTSGQIDTLVQKLYCMPKNEARGQKGGSKVEEIVEKMLAEEEIQQRGFSHEEIDDYLLRLKVTSTPRTEMPIELKRDNIQLRRKLSPNKLHVRHQSPVRLKRPKTPIASSVQSTARTEAPTLRLGDDGYSQEGSFPYGSYLLTK
eukprot:CAMPEP_0204914822 /NCGR_PEP_ID=MMETSP1397-20131031/12725_1 /ASSEMBLY_ACC=CAM_ASM_000891 /TAXON_ID=49980 /ORGANISM="Climacostomum Climacostomum virens, Strain Stock W-24" /LENGTH=305 /DNA_ID=CAMNT_0052086569 /DNA_START=242 /DNA_END=1159 /DNA_ORIENTATION=-